MPTDLGTDNAVSLLKRLMPRGRLIEYIGDFFLGMLRPFAQEIDTFRERIADLRNEGNPATSTELLPDYEDMSLYPDERADDGAPLALRRGIVDAKINSAYTGPTAQFFQDYATRFGISITVTAGKDLYMAAGDECGLRLILDESLFVMVVHHNATGETATKMKALFTRLRRRHVLISFDPVIDGSDMLDQFPQS